MKIYISGKIAGDPDYKGKFARAAAQLELLALEHPNAVDETCIGGCFGCPNTYGYEPKNKPCPHEHVHQREVKEVLCAACWDRIVPGSEALHNE